MGLDRPISSLLVVHVPLENFMIYRRLIRSVQSKSSDPLHVYIATAQIRVLMKPSGLKHFNGCHSHESTFVSHFTYVLDEFACQVALAA